MASNQSNRQELKQRSKKIGQLAHPELDWKNAPEGPSGSIQQPKHWGDSADVFVEQKKQNR